MDFHNNVYTQSRLEVGSESCIICKQVDRSNFSGESFGLICEVTKEDKDNINEMRTEFSFLSSRESQVLLVHIRNSEGFSSIREMENLLPQKMDSEIMSGINWMDHGQFFDS